MDLPFHEAANLFPLMEGSEFEAFKENIKDHGQQEPIWTYQGWIIDGRNHYRACKDLGIEPKVQEWDGKGSLVEFVASLNLWRRHLSSSQAAAVSANMIPLLEKEARERQRAAGGDRGNQHTGGKPALSQRIDSAPRDRNEGKATTQAAKITGTNRQYVQEAKKLKESDPETFAKVAAGEVTIPQTRTKTKKLKHRPKASQPPDEDEEILDDLMQPVLTGRLRDTFADRSLRDALSAIRGALSVVRSAQAWAGMWMRSKDGIEHLMGAAKVIGDAVPFAVCPACGGKKCKECNGVGWFPCFKEKEARKLLTEKEAQGKKGK